MKLKSVNEIDNMLIWLDEEITRYEIAHSKKMFGESMYTHQCEQARLHYAGCLAERTFLQKLRKRVIMLIGKEEKGSWTFDLDINVEI